VPSILTLLQAESEAKAATPTADFLYLLPVYIGIGTSEYPN